jgi:hypothetical protein
MRRAVGFLILTMLGAALSTICSDHIMEYTQAPSLPLVIHPEVQVALQHGQPVVALESTIISHGRGLWFIPLRN